MSHVREYKIVDLKEIDNGEIKIREMALHIRKFIFRQELDVETM